jgi:hypothetical protein
MRNESDGRSGDGALAKDARSTVLNASRLSLPKSGGAIRGIGEKFAANPVTSTGSMLAACGQPRRREFRPTAYSIL